MPTPVTLRPPFRKRGQARGFLLSTPGPLVDIVGSGGLVLGGTGDVGFVRPQVDSDVEVLWDFDNDGDFSEAAEDITEFVLSMETFAGRDWPSLLTGRASPARLRATLDNSDDRFSHFNAASPLNQDGNTLKTGRRLRVRTSGTASPDPVLLARDRFSRADGSLGDTENGLTWSQPLADDFAVVAMEAAATSETDEHIAVVDVAAADYYAQVRLVEVGADASASASIGGNVAGLVYRFQDTTDYSLAVLDVDAGQLQLVDVVAGTPTTAATLAVEPYDGMTIGVLVDGADVTLYLEGVPVLSDTAIQTDETEVGLYALWGANNTRPALDDFHAWDGLPAQVEGILWTGDVSDVKPDVQPGPAKTVTLEGRGWLARPAAQTITPPRSVDGRATGLLVGQTLAQAMLLQPPGPIDEGDITTGAVGMRDASAIEVARRFEETELGFLHETNEGYVGFDARSARDSAVSQATFTDDPDAFGSVLDYHRLGLLDWRREIFNRVTAGVSPTPPTVASLTTDSQSSLDSSNDLIVTMPSTVAEGDLLIVGICAFGANVGRTLQWVTPDGWQLLFASAENTSTGSWRVYAKVAAGNEDSTNVTFGEDTTATGTGCAVSHIYRIAAGSWWGELTSGVANSGVARSTTTDPEFALPLPWGPEPALFVAWRQGRNNVGGAIAALTTAALGYTDLTSTTVTSGSSKNTAIGSCRRHGVTTLEVVNWRAAGDNTEVLDPAFDAEQSAVVAVRGFSGTPPGAGVSVTVDDPDSQAEHGAIRPHRPSSNLFADTTDADDYADAVLATFADDRPILVLSFWATAHAAARQQAIARRVSDRITVVATGRSGMGFSRDFFIESIGHRWSQGRTLWETTWELSPVPEE